MKSALEEGIVYTCKNVGLKISIQFIWDLLNYKRITFDLNKSIRLYHDLSLIRFLVLIK